MDNCATRRSARSLACALFLAAAAGCAGQVSGSDDTSGSDDNTAALSAPTIRIKAGDLTSPVTDYAGNVWSSDAGFTGGTPYTTTHAVPLLYTTERYGVFRYDLPVPNGKYDVTLKFIEDFYEAAGDRVFDVSINGQPVLTSFDIFAEAGGPDLPVDRTLPVNVTAGVVTISFAAVVAQPKVCAIEIVSAIAGAGKPGYVCPPGAIVVGPSDDVAAKINAAGAGATICVEGPHYASAAILPKANQTIVGVGTDARISGARLLTGWKRDGGDVWYYDGPLVPASAHIDEGNLGGPACFTVSTFQDDVFWNDARMLRVLDLAQLSATSALPAGQRATAGEASGRFFVDVANHRIYVNQNPARQRVELATLDTLVLGHTGNDHVSFQNLFLEKALTNIVCQGGTYCSEALSWRFVDCTIRLAHNNGVHGGGGTGATDQQTYMRTLITNNGELGISSGGSWQTIEDSELSWNNIANYRLLGDDGVTCQGYWSAGATKFVLTMGTPTAPGLSVLRVESHHNVGDGFWTDIRNQYVLIAGGRFHDNERAGYVHEIGCDIEITGAEFDHNGEPIKNDASSYTSASGHGIWVSTSNNANIHDNYVHDNATGGINLRLQQGHPGMSGIACLGATADTDTSHAMMNNRVHDNTIYQCAGASGSDGVILASRNDLFASNHYHVPNMTSAWWTDPNALTWSQWTTGADAQDSGSTVATICTP